LGWLLDEQSPLSRAHRLDIVHALSGEETTDGLEIVAEPEWHDIDLLLTIKRASRPPLHVAVENKIKAVEGKGQLAAYDKHLDDKRRSGTVRKVFLTLTGEEPRSGSGWTPASYAVLLDAIRAKPASGNAYVADLCVAIERLITVAAAARAENGLVAAAAFGDDDAHDTCDVTSYIKQMRLEKVVQRIWMTDVAERLHVNSPWQVAVDETHGQALLNVQGVLEDRPGYLVGMQLQWRTLKAFCAPYPYSSKASENTHRDIEAILETIRSALVLGPNAKPSARRARGFRSFSIGSLPRGRKRDEWVAMLEPQLARLVSAFPSVRAAASDSVPLASEA
jgi:hypothetical protein